MLYQISNMSIKISYMPYEKSYLWMKSGWKPEFCCQATVRELYYLPCTKDLASRQSIDVSLLSNISTIFHAQKTWLTSGFWCQAPVRQLYNPHAPKTWLKATGLVKIRCPWNLALRWKNKVSKKLKILSEFCCNKYQTNVLKISWVRI